MEQFTGGFSGFNHERKIGIQVRENENQVPVLPRHRSRHEGRRESRLRL